MPFNRRAIKAPLLLRKKQGKDKKEAMIWHVTQIMENSAKDENFERHIKEENVRKGIFHIWREEVI